MSPAGVACLVAAFLLGGIPFSHAIARLRGVDLRSVGSGNIGATNLTRALGYGAGAVGLFLDAAKGSAAVLLPGVVLGAQSTSAIRTLAGVLAVLGHAFTPFLRFKGGKGVATGAGVFAVLSPLATLLALAVFVVVVALSRVVALGSVLAALALPVAAQLTGAPRVITLSAGIVALFIVVRHRSNLVRLLRGTERRLGAGDRT